MKKYLLQLSALLVVLSLLTGCNPDCESIQTSNIVVPPGPFEQGSELVIASNPSNLLEGRSFSISVQNANQSEVISLDTRFERSLGAAVVQLPAQLSNNATILIDDPDCTNSLIPLGTESSVVDANFFIDNPFFITPAPPVIIIPAPPITPPLKVINAWFSPNNRDYCIWFKPDEDQFGNEKSNLIPAVSADDKSLAIGPPEGSAELAVGCSATGPATDRFYHANPVSGIVDKENNFIRIRIDRTLKGLGIEEMEGQFIDPAQLIGTGYEIGGACAPDGTSKPNIMLLTSLQTGRQLILWRGAD